MNTKRTAGVLPEPVIDHLAQRTLSNSNPYLVPYLTGAMNILDVGCGTGALTLDMAERVDPGQVAGIDRDERVLDRARRAASDANRSNVMFLHQDIHDHELPEDSFDIVSNALLLHWMEEPEEALLQMRKLVRSGGWVCTVDYDLGACSWHPEIPAFERFFQAFLDWRRQAGYENGMGRLLPSLYRRVGLRSFQVQGILDVDHPLGSTYRFRTDIWSAVVDGRGPQIVEAGVLTTDELDEAREEYRAWRQDPEACQLIPKVFVAGRKL